MRLLPVLLAVALTAGCTTPPTEPIEDPEVPLFSTPPPPGAAEGREVPKTCAEVATPEEISRILNILVTGQPHPIVGVPQDNIGRTARLDCYYGVPKGKPLTTAPVWIALATYTDPRWANRRLSNTAAEEREAGARVSDVPVGPHRGILLRSPTTWTLAAARGRTTAVVTVNPALVSETHAGAQLGQLADKALTPPQQGNG